MSYCVKHAENFHTQTCRRCDDESAIAAKDAEIAALRQEIATGRGQYHRDYAAECDALLAAKDKVIADLRERCGRLERELRIIAEANPNKWGEDMRDQFQWWAQSRAKDALTKGDNDG